VLKEYLMVSYEWLRYERILDRLVNSDYVPKENSCCNMYH